VVPLSVLLVEAVCDGLPETLGVALTVDVGE